MKKRHVGVDFFGLLIEALRIPAPGYRKAVLGIEVCEVRNPIRELEAVDFDFDPRFISSGSAKKKADN